jgi:hypothetical protein
MQLTVSDEAFGVLKEAFVTVEGSCEAWTDDEVVRRVLIRGAMEYVKAGGGDFTAAQQAARQLRTALS